MPTEPARPFLDAPLPYVACLQPRPLAAVTLVVIHCTELPDLATARGRKYGEFDHPEMLRRCRLKIKAHFRPCTAFRISEVARFAFAGDTDIRYTGPPSFSCQRMPHFTRFS